jgi:hypothetical protein
MPAAGDNQITTMQTLALVVSWIAVAGLVLITRNAYRARRVTR